MLALDAEVIEDSFKIVFSFTYNKLGLLVYQDKVLKKILFSKLTLREWTPSCTLLQVSM